MKKIKLLLIFPLLFLSISCDGLIIPYEDTTFDYKNVKKLINHPDFQIIPILYSNGYPQISKINDTMYTVIVENQWQSVGRVEANFKNYYAGGKCQWDAITENQVQYQYLGQSFDAPIVNKYSYFSNESTSAMISFYKDMDGEMILILGSVYSKDKSIRYFDYVYFSIILKK